MSARRKKKEKKKKGKVVDSEHFPFKSSQGEISHDNLRYSVVHKHEANFKLNKYLTLIT